MTLIDYSNTTRLNGETISYLQQLPLGTADIMDGNAYFSLVGYNIGTAEILQQLETTNVLLCVLIALLFILVVLGSYYIITRILKQYWR